MKRLICITALFATLSARAGDIHAFYWLLTPSGSAQIGRGDILGTKLDLKDDLGYDEEVGAPGGTILFGDVLRIGVSAFSLQSDASNRMTTNIKFRDLTFSASTVVKSEIDTTMGQAFLQLATPWDTFKAIGEAGIAVATIDTSASAEGVGLTATDLTGGMPYVGVQFQLDLDALSLRAGGRYSSIAYRDDYDAKYIDLEASARVHMDAFFLGAGYRHFRLEANDNTDSISIDLELAGPVAYAGFEW